MRPKQTRSRPRPDPVATFFDHLVGGDHRGILQHASGTIRFDLLDGDAVEHWTLVMDQGVLSVTRRAGRADATARLERKLFVGMTKGTVNLTASVLRGVVEIAGDIFLLYRFDRLVPGPARSRSTFLERQKELQG